MRIKLTNAQRKMLKQYEHAGVTSVAWGSIATFRCLRRLGLLRSSNNLGVLEIEITDLGLAILKQEEEQ